jgi:hypothetical protein
MTTSLRKQCLEAEESKMGFGFGGIKMWRRRMKIGSEKPPAQGY